MPLECCVSCRLDICLEYPGLFSQEVLTSSALKSQLESSIEGTVVGCSGQFHTQDQWDIVEGYCSTGMLTESPSSINVTSHSLYFLFLTF